MPWCSSSIPEGGPRHGLGKIRLTPEQAAGTPLPYPVGPWGEGVGWGLGVSALGVFRGGWAANTAIITPYHTHPIARYA